MKDQLLTFSAGYKPATQNFTRNYFNKVRGTWDGQPRIAYLLPHFLGATKPLEAAWRLEVWMIDYIDKVYTMNTFNHGKIARTHYILDVAGANAGFAMDFINHLNPVTRQNKTPIDFNSQFNIEDLARYGLVVNKQPDVSASYAQASQLDVYDEMTNVLDNLPVALVRCLKKPEKGYTHGRLTFLPVNINLTYKIGHKDAITKNMDRITPEIRDQLWAEALYMYDDQKNDEYYYQDGYLVTSQSDPAILYD